MTGRIFSLSYLHTHVKRLDGISSGSASIWGARAMKGYGMYPAAGEGIELEWSARKYTSQDIALACKVRTNFYERLLMPYEIPIALQYSPVVLDIEIYSSIWSDTEGSLTLPDEDDVREKLDHSVMVYGHSPEGLYVDTGWLSWGVSHGRGFIPYTYLEKHFISSFATIDFDSLVNEPRQTLIKRGKVLVRTKKFYSKLFQVQSMRADKRRLFNMEIFSSGGSIAGWTHFAVNADKSVEMLELFVLPEFRLQGIGTFLFSEIQKNAHSVRVHAYIGGHDLIGDREDIVKNFFLSNDYMVFPDTSAFYDCKLRIEPLSSRKS